MVLSVFVMHTSPDTFLSRSPGDITLIAGVKSSGRSVLMKSIKPDRIIEYRPKFRSDRKKLIAELYSLPKYIIVGIETSLPTLGENSDSFLKEIFLLGKLQKHGYIVEWECSTLQKLLTNTSSKYAKTIMHAIGVKKDVEADEDDLPKFSSIQAMLAGAQADWVVEYQIPKNHGSFSLEAETFKYNVSEFIDEQRPKEG